VPSLVELPASWLLDDGPFFAFGLRPNLYRQIFPPSAVLSVWREEFRGIHEVGGLTMLILHPQYTGRPSRLNMLQQLVDEMRDTGDVWFVNGMELARYALTDAANISSDGRPRPSQAEGVELPEVRAELVGWRTRIADGRYSRRCHR